MSDNQGRETARLGRGIGLYSDVYQPALTDGRVRRFLVALRDGLPITIGTPIVPPPGCRIHTLTVKVRQDREWQDAIDAAGPDTSSTYNVRKVGDLYPAVGKGTRTEELVLLNYPRGDGSWEKAQAWAAEMRLHRTDPRTAFAIGEQHPNFHREVGINPIYVVETTGCSFAGFRQACRVRWRGARRWACLNGVADDGNARDWFAFRR